jgi:hypothetical protein
VNRDEYLAALETEPATANQRGAVMREFARLGFHPRRDRARRLAVIAMLLDLDELESTAYLTLGQAGWLVNLLQRTRDRAELPEAPPAIADDGQGDEHDSGTAASVIKSATLADALGQIAVMLWELFGPGSKPRESGDRLPASEESASDD